MKESTSTKKQMERNNSLSRNILYDLEWAWYFWLVYYSYLILLDSEGMKVVADKTGSNRNVKIYIKEGR